MYEPAAGGCMNLRVIPALAAENIGAGEGNRTLVISLEGCCSTIELHPQQGSVLPHNNTPAYAGASAGHDRDRPGLPANAPQARRLVGEVGLEPTKA
jgi:hypothetical protein